ncbi:TetR family transcriptional regulator [Sinobaca qinghaiensis]|uniref:TetR family transcriptional regulator n=1 Tax=Sinobaca qinghaiensis TaxID=342944 RepID=A0A419UWE5_9BACL|nr:TetR/AcrR family transcriptional regulator [Sinobaca qinghaiensis]RKD69459.1 TetR family transcriptional regulator [Sinobaca qinghaiensis]
MRNNIKQQAIFLFQKKGFSETSIQDIVEAVHVTKGSFYYYFTSKESLLMEIHMDYIENLLAEQHRLYEPTSQSAREKLTGTVVLLLTKIKEDGASARIFYREMRHLQEAGYSHIVERRNQFRRQIEEVITEGIHNREFRQNLNPALTTLALLGITNWSYQWFDPDGELSDREAAAYFVDLLLHGMLPKEHE